ncbi:hypothetical protein [Enterovibrio coralii]|uniref:Uncharacterized protein n=1 Tax=Enterovibrio coralii TaxID=294935 RepID=A0A135ICS2_9GAMM|nr:hypothetical protein [Enterovibrio coralii]KXF83239.1 hypothetical protein ATN88_06000 [Enterovibrio coralii]
MNDRLVERWSKEREKGQLRYVAKTSLILSLALIFGRLFGAYLSHDGVWMESHWEEVVLHSLFVLLFTPFISLVSWNLREASYKKALKRRTNR